MEGNNDWDIEEFKTKYESEEHWKLKKDFILAHKDKFNKERLICLAQVFVNMQLMRCKYPDQVMRQVEELSKGIGLDYKAVQRERLQRTFIKASDAAAEKVKGLKLSHAETGCETESDNDEVENFDSSEFKTKSNHFPVDCDKEPLQKKEVSIPLNASKGYPKHFPAFPVFSTDEIKKLPKNITEVKKHPHIGVLTDAIKEPPKNLNESKNQSEIDLIEVASFPTDVIKELQRNLTGAKTQSNIELIKVSNSEDISASKTETNHLPIESNLEFLELNDTSKELSKKKVEINESEDNSILNKNSKLFKLNPDTCLASCVSHKIDSNTDASTKKKKKKFKKSQLNSFPDVCLDLNEMYFCNIFLVLRRFSKFANCVGILNDSMRYSKIQMEKSSILNDHKNVTCTVSVIVLGQKFKLGEAVHENKVIAIQNASINAVENLLKRCFTIEIKKKTCDEEDETQNDSLKIQQNQHKDSLRNSLSISEELDDSGDEVKKTSNFPKIFQLNSDEKNNNNSSTVLNLGKGTYKKNKQKEINTKSKLSSNEKKSNNFVMDDGKEISIRKFKPSSDEKNSNSLSTVNDFGKETVNSPRLSINFAKGKSIDSNNIGAKMLALMGWSGGGLGKNEDGILEPISFSKRKGRVGIGITGKKGKKGKKEKKGKNSKSISKKKNEINLFTVNDKGKVTVNSSELSINSICSEERESIDAKICKLKCCPEKELAGRNEKENKKTSVCAEKRIDSIRAKLFKMASLPESELEKNVREIEEDSLSIKIGIEDLGFKNEIEITKDFKMKVGNILHQENHNILTKVEGVMKEIVFPSELSNLQRKYIHVLIRTKYKDQFKTISQGREGNRRLILKPKETPERLCCYLLSQGGSTDKYQLHQPGTLSVDYFFP